MVTPKLEELILCGKAFFKTAVVGGSKTTIDIDNDRFIIITDITYLPYTPQNTDYFFTADRSNNTQLSIYGERGFNHYFFANRRRYWMNVFAPPDEAIPTTAMMPLGVQKIDCYLLHTTQVGFSFLVSSRVPVTTNGVAPFNNPAYDVPLDYGKDGMPGALNVDTDITMEPGLLNQVVNRATGLGIGSAVSQQIQFPATINTTPEVDSNPEFPIANINYVEILGQPNNIGI